MPSSFSHFKKVAFAAVAIALTGCGHDEPLTPLRRAAPVLPPVKRISVTIDEYCDADGDVHADFFAFNLSYRILKGRIQPDFDADGVLNIDDNRPDLGTKLLSENGNGDAFGDFMTTLLEIPVATRIYLPECDSVTFTTADLLNDCEKRALHLSPSLWSYSGGLLSDAIKLRYGLDPFSDDESHTYGGDPTTNLERVRANLPTHETLTEELWTLAVQYHTTPYVKDGLSCRKITVSRIPVIDGPLGNKLAFFFVKKGPDDRKDLVVGKIIVPNAVLDGSEIRTTYTEVVK